MIFPLGSQVKYTLHNTQSQYINMQNQSEYSRDFLYICVKYAYIYSLPVNMQGLFLHEREKQDIMRTVQKQKHTGDRLPMENRTDNSYLAVDLGILRSNVRAILSTLGENVQLIPVLKDDAYGLGAIPVAQTLCEFPEIQCFAVAHVSEGILLRSAGIDREILVMGSSLPFQIPAALQADLTLTCGRPGFLRELSAVAKERHTRAKFQLKIDIGLHRIGIEPEHLSSWIREYRECEEDLLLKGVFSHFSEADSLHKDEAEFQRFQSAVAVLEENGIPVPLKHVAASYSSEHFPQFSLDAVRCGRRLYMDRPTDPTGMIREVASWRGYLTAVSRRKKGECIGYSGKVQLKEDSMVATVSVGYGDGLNQDLFGVGAPVLVGGIRCPLLACCMDQCLVDVTAVDCKAGDEVTFFGYDGKGAFLSSQEIASLINDDEGCGLTSALSPRVARVYECGN